MSTLLASLPSQGIGAIYDAHAGVAAPDAHVGGEQGPGVRLGVVGLDVLQVGRAVVAAHDVEEAVVRDDPGVPAAEVHLAHDRPLVLLRVEALHGLSDLKSE